MAVEEPRVGVYICHCGGNISDIVDVEKVREAVSHFHGVKVAEAYQYMCSKAGQELIKEGIVKHGVNRIVEASCSPIMHLNTFRQAAEAAGLNPYLVEMVNIREHCSWVHTDKDMATQKAIDLIRGAVGRARRLEALEPRHEPVLPTVMVIGGGVSGIFTSLELANKGYKVYLVERLPSIGGHMIQLSKTFPTLDCSTCILAPRMVDVAQHPNIEIISMAEPIAVDGQPGNYNVTLKVMPRCVDVENCSACGSCEKVCPSRVPNEYEGGFYKRKAIFIPYAQAIPSAYTIDREHCLYFQKNICGVCAKFCTRNAINFEDEEETRTLDVGSIVVSAGFQLADPTHLGEYNYGQHPDIVTNLQFERLFLKGLVKPSNKQIPKKVAFILCVGSRSLERGQPYCSKICCMVSVKQAFLLKEMVSGAEPWIFYTDMRAAGKWYEEFYARAREHGVKFVRGRVAEVTPVEDNKILLKAEDTLLGMQLEDTFDLVVLSPAMLPPAGMADLAKMMGLDIGPDGFLVEKHYKLEPVDSRQGGIYICGCAVGPKDIRESTLEAIAVASRVSSFLGKGETTISPETAYVISEKCDGCGLCLQACPVASITMTAENRAAINPITCVGCGLCVPACGRGAIDLKNCSEAQMTAMIRGAAEGTIKPKIIAFTEKTTAYKAADTYGMDRRKYPPNILIVEVPSAGRVGLRHVMEAFAAGADGILFVEGEDSIMGVKRLRQYVNELRQGVGKYGVKRLRMMAATVTLPQYYKLNVFDTFASRIARIGSIKPEIRSKIKEALK